MPVTIQLFSTNTKPWMAKAACTQGDPDRFFPETKDKTAAKKVCNTCPVRAQCLNHAIEHDESWGIWGGLDEKERRHLQRVKKQPTITPQCGTYTGARAHYRRGEETCPACRAAITAESRQRRGYQTRTQPTKPPTPGPKCGTEAGAKEHNTRQEQTCDDCRQAATQARRRRLGLSA
ncbi:hypothetical protein MMRN_41880 [Mycobacterium marinum]|nr:hypothetical protein MMRN_41880 [Mycobacterium marinum]